MQHPSLFPEAAPQQTSGSLQTDADRPLADRLRPSCLREVIGQDHLTGSEGTLTRMIARGVLPSLILWGPPGVGKTTIARLLAGAAGLRFVQLSAVFSGVADLKKVFEEATKYRRIGQVTLLFVDEIHRFNRAQQDGFLPVVEDGTVILVGATTENPSFALNGALLSRCQVLVLRRLDDAAMDTLLARAEAALGHNLKLTLAARASLRAMADGDGRYLLNMAEQLGSLPDDDPTVDADALPSAMLVTAFGHGKHSCPAQPFSLSAMANAVIHLVAGYDLAPGWTSHPQPVRAQIGGVARAAGPCPVRYVRR